MQGLIRQPKQQLALIALLTMGITTASAQGLSAGDIRISSAIQKYDDTTQVAMTWQQRMPFRYGVDHIEYAVGAISAADTTRPFVSVGPVWSIPFRDDRFSLKLGFSPTIISGSTFDDRDLGGNLHFTSSASIQTTFGRDRQLSLALRLQHISNGGLSSNNPGMDMLGLSFSYRFDR